MAAFKNSPVQLELLDAIKSDDMKACESLMSANPKVLYLLAWPENPLFVASLKGNEEVILLLLRVCPDLIEQRTSKQQTVLHLVTECKHHGVFKVLLGEVKRLNKEYLLDEKDELGNTVLHVAVNNKQLRIVEMCLKEDGFANRVKAMNNNGDTALSLYYKIPNFDLETQEIGRFLREASRDSPRRSTRFLHEASRSSPRRSSRFLHEASRGTPRRRTTPSRWTLEIKRGYILAVLAIFFGLAFAVIGALPTFFPKESLVKYIGVVYGFKDVIYGELPLVFYIIFFITVGFMTCIGLLFVLLYSLPCRSLMFLGGFATFAVYLLLSNENMPKFFVRAGSYYNVPSYYFMLILVIVFICVGALIIRLGNCLTLVSYNCAKLLMRKLVSIFRPPSNEMLPLHNLHYNNRIANAISAG
ncbi:hypothetical protein LWI28_012839 [Acer negundo]|uniref:Uncharacterized protein n=1 Tax=Acer negundo TaxID=4023 RepID=A0AAD5IEI8_ACENE|nr:hypothetical protein LWI28_012839 [Acer negundo]